MTPVDALMLKPAGRVGLMVKVGAVEKLVVVMVADCVIPAPTTPRIEEVVVEMVGVAS